MIKTGTGIETVAHWTSTSGKWTVTLVCLDCDSEADSKAFSYTSSSQTGGVFYAGSWEEARETLQHKVNAGLFQPDRAKNPMRLVALRFTADGEAYHS